MTAIVYLATPSTSLPCVFHFVLYLISVLAPAPARAIFLTCIYLPSHETGYKDDFGVFDAQEEAMMAGGYGGEEDDDGFS
jgi:hypothetical protein